MSQATPDGSHRRTFRRPIRSAVGIVAVVGFVLGVGVLADAAGVVRLNASVPSAGSLLVGYGLAVGLGWLLLPAPFAFVFGQLGLLVVFPAFPTVGELMIVETVLFLLLGASLVSLRGSALVVTAVAGASLSTGVAWLGAANGSQLVPAVATVAVATTATAYSLHRYELVRLGLVEGPS